jgi:soluble lytic murein transglycosylase
VLAAFGLFGPVLGFSKVAKAAVVGARGPTGQDAGSLARGVAAFRAGAYSEAEKALRGGVGKGNDWALYLHAESAFYSGAVTAARDDFEKLAKGESGRFTSIAAFRVADCLWSGGARADAVDRYRRLLARAQPRPPSGVDTAVARFRVALFAEEQHKPEAQPLFLALYRDLPAHPLATEAQTHLPRGLPAAQNQENAVVGSVSATPADQLRRAETLARDRNWAQALDELAKLPADLPPGQATERDFQIGMTKFQMRRDYGRAAELLLKVVPALSGDKAASALFHGTRALSRIDRDDDAIAGYKQVVQRFPQSRYAAEAQFLAGWLDYNRGRYRESLSELRATLDRFGKSAFADDAAWCVAFAHFLLGELPQAKAGFDRYARMPATGMTSEERAARVAYWLARVDAKAMRAAQAKAAYREVSKHWPFSFYGVAARARLAELGENVGAELPRRVIGPLEGRKGENEKAVASDPVLARIDELAAVGLDVEAGWQLQAEEKSVLRRWGEARGTKLLLTRYPGLRAFRRAYEISENRNGGALSAAPERDPNTRLWWQAAYPRAYRDLVDRYGPPAGNPDLLLYAIMRKESGFSPWDVSSADARGLLQMIPPTSARVAAEVGIPFFPDELFDPETNVRLGAAYIGGLSRKFKGQIPLIAGAFNAGPKAMAKWCDQHGSHPMDEFVELFAFTQTREYAKRVVGILSRYRHLYGPTPYQLPIGVDGRYAASGPDY